MRRISTGREGSQRDKAFYDSSILIAYLFAEEDRFHEAKKVLAKHKDRYISIISIHELGYYSRKMNVEERFLKLKPKIYQLTKTISLSQEVCIKAVQLRSIYKLPEIDALIAATAIHHNMDYFYTFDEDFTDMKGRIIQNTRIIKI